MCNAALRVESHHGIAHGLEHGFQFVGTCGSVGMGAPLGLIQAGAVNCQGNAACQHFQQTGIIFSKVIEQRRRHMYHANHPTIYHQRRANNGAKTLLKVRVDDFDGRKITDHQRLVRLGNAPGDMRAWRASSSSRPRTARIFSICPVSSSSKMQQFSMDSAWQMRSSRLYNKSSNARCVNAVSLTNCNMRQRSADFSATIRKASAL